MDGVRGRKGVREDSRNHAGCKMERMVPAPLWRAAERVK